MFLKCGEWIITSGFLSGVTTRRDCTQSNRNTLRVVPNKLQRDDIVDIFVTGFQCYIQSSLDSTFSRLGWRRVVMSCTNIALIDSLLFGLVFGTSLQFWWTFDGTRQRTTAALSALRTSSLWWTPTLPTANASGLIWGRHISEDSSSSVNSMKSMANIRSFHYVSSSQSVPIESMSGTQSWHVNHCSDFVPEIMKEFEP